MSNRRKLPMDTAEPSDLRCEICDYYASFAALEMVKRPANGEHGEAQVLRHHLLCAVHANDFPGFFLIAGQGCDD
jgi:hypothetical protein